jgi:hypothetical protein
MMVAIASTNIAWSEEKYSFGAGAGVPFSGLGIGITRYSNNDYSFASVGCFGWRGEDFDETRDCGLSVGFFTNGLFSNNKLSLGPVLSFSDSNEYFDVGSAESGKHILKTRVGLGLNYHFYGFGQGGVIAGVTAYYLDSSVDSGFRLGLQIGYQW